VLIFAENDRSKSGSENRSYNVNWLLLNGLGMAIVGWQAISLPGPLSIEQAADIAAKNAFEVRTQSSLVEQSRQRVGESRAAAGLQVTANGTYTRYSRPQESQGGSGGSLSDASSAVLSAQIPIDISGQYRNNNRFFEATLAASKLNLLTATLDAKLKAREAYLAVLKAQANAAVAEMSVRDAQAQLEQSEKLYAEQSIALIDVSRYKAQLSRFKSELIERQNELQIAKHALNQELALPIEQELELADVPDPQVQDDDPNALIDLALKHRPEILALQETAKAYGYSIAALKAGLRPSMTLALDYQPKLGSNSNVGANNLGTLSLSVSIPLHDSGATRSRTASARQDQLQTLVAIEKQMLLISQEVRDLIATKESAVAKLSNALDQQKYAEEVYKIALIRQEAGQGTYVDVIDAATLLAQARTDVVSARYEVLSTAMRLKRALADDLPIASQPDEVGQ